MKKRIFLFLLVCIGFSSNLQAQKSAEIRIKEFLQANYADASSTSRSYIYNAIDLNDDGKNEYLVGLMGGEWCGSAGCTMLVLNSAFKLNTKMTVVEYPVYVGPPASKEVTRGYSNLYIENRDGSVSKMSWNGKKYPTNPSMAPKVNKKIIDGKYKFLNQAELTLQNF